MYLKWECILSFVKNLKNEYDDFLSYLEPIVKEDNQNSGVSRTKLEYYRKQLNKIELLPEDEQYKLIEIVNKYTNLNCLLNNSTNIDFKKSDLLKIIEGQFSLNDKDQKYNDTFFELSMALRFAKSSDLKSNINMNTICDVIIGGEIAVECKYIHSKKNILANISYAIEQIDDRVARGLAKYGFVAIDFSNVIDNKKIENFAKLLYEDFSHGYKRIGKNDDEVLESVLNDRNFSTILGKYFAHNLEVEFYENLFKLPKEKIGFNTKAIIFQANTSFSFCDSAHTIPVPIRSLTYFINPKITDEDEKKIVKIIHSLCSGI